MHWPVRLSPVNVCHHWPVVSPLNVCHHWPVSQPCERMPSLTSQPALWTYAITDQSASPVNVCHHWPVSQPCERMTSLTSQPALWTYAITDQSASPVNVCHHWPVRLSPVNVCHHWPVSQPCERIGLYKLIAYMPSLTSQSALWTYAITDQSASPVNVCHHRRGYRISWRGGGQDIHKHPPLDIVRVTSSALQKMTNTPTLGHSHKHPPPLDIVRVT